MNIKRPSAIIFSALLLTFGSTCRMAVAEEAKAAPDRVLAAPEFPDSFTDRSWHEGELQTDLGPAKYQDMYANRKAMHLTLRRFMVAAKAWELKSPKKMLDDARDNILRGEGAPKLVSEKDFAVDGFPGRSFLFLHEKDNTVERMDWFLLRPNAFIFTYSGPKAGLESADVKAFFKGIKTMEAKANNTPKAK